MRKNGNLEEHLGKFGRMASETALNIFKNKKVFVTGHTGFKGGWLLGWLHLLGADVKGYALIAESDKGIYHTINGDSICKSIIADIRDEKRLTTEINEFKPDIVFHLAAQPLVRRSYLKPTETFEVNVLGTANLLNAIRPLEGNCAVVVITTDKVYENYEWSYPYREVDTLGGYDPYSASKACTEIVVNSFRQSFFNPNDFSEHGKSLASVRAGNVIGGGDWSEDRIIPDIVRSLEADGVMSVRNPDSIRPWQHVLDPLYGYLSLAAELIKNPTKFSGAYNFGPLPNDFLPVSKLVDLSIKSWGSGEWNCPETIKQPHEARVLKLDISKAMDLLNWLPALNSAQAIDWTISWYKKNLDDKMNYTFEQIKSYQSLQ